MQWIGAFCHEAGKITLCQGKSDLTILASFFNTEKLIFDQSLDCKW